MLDETIILFTSDHGGMPGDHGMWARQALSDGSSSMLPMMLVRAVGIEAPDHIDGRSMKAGDQWGQICGESSRTCIPAA